METRTIISQFRTEGLSFVNGRHHYYGDLMINNDVEIWDNIVVHGDLVVAGNLTSHGKIVANNIKVDGDFIAGRNIIAAGSVTVGKMFGCYANARIRTSLEAGWFWVDGNLMVPIVRTSDTSTVHGWMKASTVYGNVICDGELINKKN